MDRGTIRIVVSAAFLFLLSGDQAQAAVFQRHLHIGMSGADVRALQVALNSAAETRLAGSGTGSPGRESSYFGSLTEDAVKRFQLRYASEILRPVGKSSPTGYVGQFTLAKLNSLSAGEGTQSAAAFLPRSLSLGMSGEDVRSLQRILNAQGFLVAASGAGSPGNESSYFGTKTQAALRRFQCAAMSLCSGSAATNGWGMADERTRASLTTASLQPRSQKDIASSASTTYLVIATSQPGSVASNNGTLTGTITTNIDGASLRRGFEYGLSSAYGSVIWVQGAFVPGGFSAKADNLLCDTVYHFRAFVQAPTGNGYGADKAFVTLSCASPTPLALTTPGATPGPADLVSDQRAGILVDDFSASASEWAVYPGPEFPGATANFSTGAGRSGQGGRLSFNMSGSAHYVMAQRALPASLTADRSLSSLSFWVKAPPASTVFAQVHDSSGQTLSYHLQRSIEPMASPNSWMYHTVDLGAPTGYWSGASDGRMHLPIASIGIGIEPARYSIAGTAYFSDRSGSIDFDDIVLNAPSPVVDPSSSAVYPVSYPDLGSNFGAIIHGNNYQAAAYDRLQQLGAKNVRIDVLWDEVEKEKGRYDFALYDPVVSELYRRGMKTLMILCYGNPIYGMAKNAGPTSDEQRSAFLSFASAVVGRYKDKNISVEIWNEPNLDTAWSPNDPAQYARFANAVAAKVREIGPGIPIVTGGLSSIGDLDWMSRMLDAGASQGADAIGWHPYTSAAPESILPNLYMIRSLIAQKTGRSMPVWNTEWGYPSAWYGTGDVARRTQAKLVVRQALTNALSGLPFNSYYDLYDDGTNPSEQEQTFGLYDASGSAKPAAQAMLLYRSNTLGWSVPGLISYPDPHVHILKLQSGSAVRLIAWTDSNPNQPAKTVRLALARAPASVTDLLGAPIPVSQGSGYPAVTVSDEPVYIQF